MTDCSFTQHVLNIHRSGYSAVYLLHGWCHVKLPLSRYTLRVNHTTMHQFTVSLCSTTIQPCTSLQCHFVRQPYNHAPVYSVTLFDNHTAMHQFTVSLCSTTMHQFTVSLCSTTIQPCTSLQCHFVRQPCISLQCHFVRQPYNHAPVYSITLLVTNSVTCHLHLEQNARDLLRATAVTQGWTGYRNRSQHRKLTTEKKKILPPFLPWLEPDTFRSLVRHSTTEPGCPRYMLIYHADTAFDDDNMQFSDDNMQWL